MYISISAILVSSSLLFAAGFLLSCVLQIGKERKRKSGLWVVREEHPAESQLGDNTPYWKLSEKSL